MTDWLARARREFSESPGTPTDRTDETPISSVSSVPPPGVCRKHDAVSSVSSVPPQGIPEKRVSADRPAGPATKAALAIAIDRCCALRGDEDSHRRVLADECLALPERNQRELIEHFEEQARIWERATTLTDETDETDERTPRVPGTGQTRTDETDRTPLSSVLAVAGWAISENTQAAGAVEGVAA